MQQSVTLSSRFLVLLRPRKCFIIENAWNQSAMENSKKKEQHARTFHGIDKVDSDEKEVIAEK